MYSVLIQNHKTMGSFSKFHSLFLKNMNDKSLGVCKWTEGGTTPDTAVPGLAELTNDKSEWRAVIVQYEDDKDMMQVTHTAENPFDYPQYESADIITESEVPIIRLTHMLGGVPEPPAEFRTVSKTDENGKKKVTVEKVSPHHDKEAYALLKKKYQFNGNPPSSIILISVRVNQNKNELQEAWNMNTESNSSDFWKRNRYPGNCRFLIFDRERKGSVQKDEEDFRFWLSVLQIVSAEKTPSVLQPYKLYRLNVSLNKEAMKRAFQHSTDHLRIFSEAIQKEIKTSIEIPVDINPELPDCQVTAAVKAVLPNEEEFQIDQKSFGILGKGSEEELAFWESKRKSGEKSLAKSLKLTKRSLDQTADKIRKITDLNDNDVPVLDQYQMDDLLSEINEIYIGIVQMQGRMPKVDSVSSDENIENASEGIKQFLKERVKGNAFAISCAIALSTILAANISGILNLIINNKGSWLVLLVTILAEMMLTALSATVALLFQKRRLNKLIGEYNRLIEMLFDKLIRNTDDYSRYLSSIITHIRGYSFIHRSLEKRNDSNLKLVQQYRQLKATEKMLATIRKWNRAFELNIDFDAPVDHIRLNTDTANDSDENTFYTFETDKTYHVEINHSGELIRSPFDFAERLIIVREELYNEH